MWQRTGLVRLDFKDKNVGFRRSPSVLDNFEVVRWRTESKSENNQLEFSMRFSLTTTEIVVPLDVNLKEPELDKSDVP